MPYRPPFLDRFDTIYEPAIKAAGLVAQRMDRRIGSFEIADQIRSSIAACDVFLADVSDEEGRLNGNVYHEVGFAQALRKPVITIVADPPRRLFGQSGAGRIAFNLQGVKHLTLSADRGAEGTFRETLQEYLQEAVRNPQDFVVFRGYQALDPDLVGVLLDLHMRSSRLAVIDELDTLMAEPGGGRGLSPEDIYRRFGAVMNRARNMLKYVVVELVDNFRDDLTLGNRQEPLATYVASVTDASKRAFNMKIVALISEALQSTEALEVKRSRFAQQLKEFQEQDYLPLAKKLIKSAYFDKAEVPQQA